MTILEITEINKGSYSVWNFRVVSRQRGFPPTGDFRFDLPPGPIDQTGQVNIFGNVNSFVF